LSINQLVATMKYGEFDDLKLSDIDSFKYQLSFEQLCLEHDIEASVSASEEFDELYKEIQLEGKVERNTTAAKITAPGPKKETVVLSLKTILSLIFREENSSNYPSCLRNFMQSRTLVEVLEEKGDIIFHYKTREQLLRLLESHCGIKTMSSLQKLNQRADFKLLPGMTEYKLLVYLNESQDLKYPVREVMKLLGDQQIRFRTKNKFRIEIHVPDLYQVVQLITNQKLREKGNIIISNDNIIFRSSFKGLDLCNGDICVTEKEFLRLMSGSVDITEDMAKVLSQSKVKDVFQDWNSDLVFTFSTTKDYKNFLALLEAKQSIDDKVIAIVPHDNLYVLETKFRIDIRDFLPIDRDCLLSPDSRKICCKNKVFPFLCFKDENIMKKYSVKLSAKCFTQERK